MARTTFASRHRQQRQRNRTAGKSGGKSDDGQADAGRRELSEFELAQIRRQIESLETIDVVSDEVYALIEQQWSHLLAKIRFKRT
jgi:hypothetical protein